MIKLHYLLSVLFMSILFVSCSSESDNILQSSNEKVTENVEMLINAFLKEEYEPYISSQMQDVLSMIDTCTAPIPIQQLVSDLSVFSADTLGGILPLTKSADGTTVAIGYSNMSYLYSNVSTTIDQTTASNMNFGGQPGTYTVTCVAVTYYLLTNGKNIHSATTNTDIMGMNPDDSSQRGYVVEQKVANQLYYLTTYIYYLQSAWYPRIPKGSGYTMYTEVNDFANHMQWRYYAF